VKDHNESTRNINEYAKTHKGHESTDEDEYYSASKKVLL
jgi:hypothetical protein